MAEFIEILSPSALKDLQTANLEVVKLVANIDKVGQNMAKIATPSGSDSATKKLVTDYQTLEKQLAKTQQQLEKNRLQEIRIAQAREKAFDKYDAQLKKEQTLLAKANNLYNQTQTKVNELSQSYNNLAIKKELGQQLTLKEQIQLEKLTRELNIYQSALKKVDADIQKNQRNVGNYASGWNGLGNSINQLSREMPAFANSAQTGFMALSNNLPILFDEIERIKTSNKELLAQGLPTKSLFSQIAGAVFSWGTALSVGVTLLTIFGPKLWDMVAGTKASKKALEEEKKVREEKASVEKQAYEQQVKYASDEQAKAKILLETAKNLTLSMKQREQAVSELQQKYPTYLGYLSKEQILAGDTADAEFRLNDALMKRAMFLAVQDKIIETTKQLVDAEMEYIKTNKEAIKTDELYDISTQKKTASKQKYRLVNEQDLATTKGLESAVKSGDKTIKNSTTIYNEKTLATKKQLDILYSLLNGYAKYADVVVEDTKNTKNNTKAKREDIEAVNGQIQTNEGYLKRLKDQRKGFQDLQQQVSDTSKEFQDFQTIIDGLTQSINLIEDPSKVIKSDGINEFMKIYSNRVKTGLDETKGFWEQHGQEVVDLSQDLINTLAEISNAQFEQQYQRLEKERDIAIMFAGESVSAREEIERQYEKRRASIQRKQAEAEKKMAVFNIITDTAQAIVASLVRDPTGTLAILIGAIGAAQLGLVLSQPIPQFAKGTDNAPEGWALTQEKGREIITDKYGKVKSLGNDKGAQYTYLNKGDKVFTNQDTEAMLFNSNLNNMLLGNGIAMPKVEVSLDAEKITNEIKSLANTIANKEGLTIVRDERGERKYLRKQNETKELLNNVLTYKGIDV